MQRSEFETLHDEIREIRQEQRRLREQQDHLRHDADELKETRRDDADERSGQKQEEEESARERRRKQESCDEQKQNNGKKQEEKPPFKQRARQFISTHRKQVFTGAIAVVVLGIAAVFLVLYLLSYESTDDAQVDGHLNAISARVTGTVQQVYVEDNQVIQAGQLLVELDPRDFETALEQARAQFSAAEAQLKAENPNVPIIRTSNESLIATSQDAVRNAQSAVLAAEHEYQSRLAALSQAEASDAKTQRDLIRYRGLIQKDEISRQQFDTAVTAAKSDAAGVIAARAAADAGQKQIEETRAQLLQAQARLNEAERNAPRSLTMREAGVEARQAALLSARSQADQAALNLSYTKIYAPVSGIISNKTVELGQRVEPGEQLFVISQTEYVWITANFKETQLKKMRAGQGVDIKVDTFGRKYHGYIQSLPGATGARTSLLPPENATGNFVKVVQRLPVRIRLEPGDDPDHLLRPGMSVEPKVWLK